jgi:predicted transposase YbfD/YdcC
MVSKKGRMPTHIKKKHFEHPGIEHPVIQILERLEDPRKPSFFFRYSLTTVLFMTIIAVMCGATDWPKVIVMATGMRDWLAKYVDMAAGIPCERTFINVMNMLSPEALERVLRDLSSIIREKIPYEVISFDGQTARGTADRQANVSGIHLISAWSAENGICLGQSKVDDKSNEIAAVPELMEALDLKGAIITADALNTQKAIAAKVIEKEGDYLLPVKGNQPTLLEEIISAFESVDTERSVSKTQWERAIAKSKEQRDDRRLKQLLAKGASSCGAFVLQSELEKSHGRIETRSCMTISSDVLPSKSEWKNINSLARVERKRILGDKMEHEVIYYISSLPPCDVQLIANATRKHWRVENSLHWRLDVVFRQDQSRYRNRIGARNLATIRKMVLNVLSKETSLKGGIATKQCAAACNPAYRDKVLTSLLSTIKM